MLEGMHKPQHPITPRFAAIAIASSLALGCGGEADPDPIDGPTASTAAPLNVTGHYFPWPAGQTATVIRTDEAGHMSQVDFNIPGTVCASKPGKVVFVKQSSDSGCNDLSCWEQANVVVIQHDSGEYSWYYHLVYQSVPVQVGTYVSAGTRIGTEGATGFADMVHLHFMVSTSIPAWTDPTDPNRAPWPTGITKVDFIEKPWANLSAGSSQVSQNGTDISVTSASAGSIELYVHGQDNMLYRRTWSNNAWQTVWEQMGGVLTSAPDADSWSVNHREVIVRGLTNEVWSQRWNTSSWVGFTSLGLPGGGATSDPSVAARADGMLDVYVRGADNALWRKPFSNGSWGAWISMGGTLVGGVDAMSWGANHTDVFALATDGNLYHRYIDKQGAWRDWTPMGQPAGGIGSDSAAVCTAYNTCFLFVRGKDRQIWGRNYTGVWGNWYPLGGTLTSGPDAVASGSSVEVWARGVNNNVYRRTKTAAGAWTAWQDMGSTP
jgi:murein DD-endopeptidase MepM/ murein hydrolase activator NlpD